jgi:hypothetical protein
MIELNFSFCSAPPSVGMRPAEDKVQDQGRLTVAIVDQPSQF